MTAQLPSREILQKIIETANEIITVNNGTNEDIWENDTATITRLYDRLNDDLANPSVVKALAEFALVAQEQEPAEWATYYPDTDEESGREHSRSNEATARRSASEIKGYVVPVYYGNPAPVPAVTMPADLHPDTKKLVADFSAALAEKLYKAQLKYGYSDNWKRGDWSEQCLQHFHQHIAKGDPRDVAAYCAFMWYHGWKTESQAPVPAVPDVELIRQLKTIWWDSEDCHCMSNGTALKIIEACGATMLNGGKS